MDKLKLFIQAMTFWNWLALVAFIIALLGGLNAFLSLKARYRDWKGTRNKTQFDKRISELTTQFFMMEQYKQDSIAFFTRVLSYASELPIPFLISIAFFTIGALFWPSYLLALLFMFSCIKTATKLNQLITRVSLPELFAIEIVDFVKSAADKGLASEDAARLILKLGHSKVYSESEREIIFNYIGRRYPEKLSSFMQKQS
jgi:hypothetical protein